MKAEEKQWVIIGLGNPGKRYIHTRHNMGYLVVQSLAEQEGWKFKEESSFHAELAKGKMGDRTVHLLLPLTYMNLSGQTAKAYLDFFKLSPSNLIVIHDEFALSFGQFRLRMNGGAGGHNGLKSLAAYLQTPEFVRLRIGIGNEKGAQTLADYVLDLFSAEERLKLPSVIEQGVQIVRRLVSEEIPAVMNSINAKPKAVLGKDETNCI